MQPAAPSRQDKALASRGGSDTPAPHLDSDTSLMPTKPRPANESSNAPAKDRRADPKSGEAHGPLRQLKSALRRPVALQWQNGQPRVVLVERRKARRTDEPSSPQQLCEELRARLLAQAPEETAKLLRYLVLVHEALSKNGWIGVAALPLVVLGKALRQAEMLSQEDPSAALNEIIEHLQALHTAAVEHREASIDSSQEDAEEHVEVSETSYQEYEELERSWVRTSPSDLAPLQHDS
jgi:hypothetical protein